MKPIVLKADPKKMQQIKKHYESFASDRNPAGALFQAKTNQCTITGYKSGKILFQGAASEVEAQKWDLIPQVSKEKSVSVNNQLPPDFASLSVIGSDEVGTGDYFGPMTVVAAYVSTEQIPLLQELGVQDSKNLKDPRIMEIAQKIKELVPHSLLTLHNDKYNTLQKKGMSQGKMKAFLHNQAIGHVLKKIEPETPEAILIDQFAQKEIYYNYLKDQQIIHKKDVYFSTKAEGIHLAVAAASILARYAFIQHFELLSLRAGFTLPKGAGPIVDKAAARLLLEKGEDEFASFVKYHFANTEKAKAIAKKGI